jgi:hypothetical protein
MTLVETAIAMGILLVVTLGLLSMGVIATSITENEGHLNARTTEYALDKMEQLLTLAYGDAQSNTTFFPSVNVGGTGLALGGSSNPETPVVGYADYLDQSGNVLCTAPSPCGATPPASWFYKRVWHVAIASANLKQVTVTTIVRSSVARAKLARSTVTALKDSHF